MSSDFVTRNRTWYHRFMSVTPTSLALLSRLLWLCLLPPVAGCAHEPSLPLRLLGEWHPVAPGDTVASVSKQWDVHPDTLAELNELPRTGPIPNGVAEIFIPLDRGAPPGTGTVEDGPSRREASTMAVPPQDQTGRCDGRSLPCLEWPAEGPISRTFGGNTDGTHHDGIDITAPTGSPVTAAAAGTVIYSGDAIKGYGNLIILRHANDLVTIYAHNEQNMAREGDTVSAGDLIARIGSSGAAQTPHLHFETRQRETPVDPLDFLPPREQP